MDCATFGLQKNKLKMKILVCVSKVPDTTTKINFSDNNTRLEDTNITWIMNPTDEWYALVRALELKEATKGTVTLINVGGTENDPIIRKGLAIGADDAVRINGKENDPYQIAFQIAEFAKSQKYDLILTGKETISYNGYLIGGLIAEFLDLPYVGNVTKLDIENAEAKVLREIEGAIETLHCSLPMVVSAQKGMAEARIPNMRGIMAAKSKPLQVIEATSSEELVSVLKFEQPQPKQSVKLFKPEEVNQLVEALHQEAKVI